MKKLLIIIIITIAASACNSSVDSEQHSTEAVNHQKHVPDSVQQVSGKKWKADEATKKNVAALVQVMNDGSYADPTKSAKLSAALQVKVDTLIKECRMRGAEHDALHVWLEKVLNDIKKLKEDEGGHDQAYARLKKDIEGFYDSFE